MIALARVVLFLSGTLVLSHYLPKFYWLLFAERIRTPHASYSNVEEDFLFYRWDDEGVTYSKRGGELIDRESLEALTPLSSYSQLMADGRMPESLHGVELDVRSIRSARMMARIKPDALDAPTTGLGRLLESAGRSVKLEMPDDFVRFGERIEFLDPLSNSVNEDKSGQFTAALSEAGFVFPVILHGGNPTDRKAYDEGYYLLDAVGEVFHLRMVKGEAEVKQLSLAGDGAYQAEWKDVAPAYLLVSEQSNRELRCMIIDEDDRLWMVVGENYRPVQIELRHYDPLGFNLSFRGDLFSRTLLVKGDGILEALALDREYRKLTRYEERLPVRENTVSGEVFRILFPWEWDLEDGNSAFLGFYVNLGSVWVLAVNSFLTLVLLFWNRRNLRADPVGFLMMSAVLLGGVYALISNLLTPSPVSK